MLFNSWQYAVFLPIVFALYWLMPHRYRWGLLLAASYYFYMSWNIKYVVLILFTTVVSYAAALLLENHNSVRQKKLILWLAALLCLGVLFIFKYLNFFFDSLSSLLAVFSIPMHPVTLRLLLPVGISFYTFQTLSYVIDVYRGEVPAERHFGIYATFVSFFPQLVAGPIERTENLLPQIRGEHTFDSDQAMYGAKLMLWGFFKKMAIADNLAVYVDRVFDNLPEYQGFALVLGAFFFTIQIYCDFSGYSDIARGTANLLGIRLMENFKSPYFSASVKEFWSRWHISLSTWFRDYVYIPLGGNRVSRFRHSLNLLLTFLVSGLWHGANWTFVVWGGVHGIAQITENSLGLSKKVKSGSLLWWIRVCLTFAFAAAAWVFFRAQTLGDAMYVFRHMFDGIASPHSYLSQGLYGTLLGKTNLLVYTVLFFVPLFFFDLLAARKDCDPIQILEKTPKVLQWCIFSVLALILVFFTPKGVAAEFVYFQF